jgi:hypothetical protein
VRAGLIADHCFEPDVENPQLQGATVFPRWDRLGFEATAAYEGIRTWIQQRQDNVLSHSIATPVEILEQAMQQFFLAGQVMPGFEQLAVLRSLMETAQHYWELVDRLRAITPENSGEIPAATVGRFIQMLRGGAVTANPMPTQLITTPNAVTLATVFQYRSSRRSHRWQFWFDAGTTRWLSGIDSLFGAPFFLQSYSHQPWTVDDQEQMNEQRLHRILQDLLGRSTERVTLCYSDLATNGQEQTGVLLALVNAATPLVVG